MYSIIEKEVKMNHKILLYIGTEIDPNSLY